MAKGFVSGAVWGTVLSVAALSSLSVLHTSQTEQIIDGLERMSRTPDADATADGPAETDAAAPDPAETADMDDGSDAEMSGTDDAPVADAEDAPEAVASAPEEPEESAVVADSTDENAVEESLPETAPENQEAEEETAEATVDFGATSQPGRRPADVDDVDVASDAPALDAPDTVFEVAPAETAPAPMPTPETGGEIAALGDPDTPDTSVSAPTSTGSSSPQIGTAPSLDAPAPETGITVATEPAQPPTPSAPDVQTALVADTDEPAEEGAASGETDDPVAEADDASDMSASDAEPDTSPDEPATAETETAGTAQNPTEPTAPVEQSQTQADSAASERPTVRRLVPDTVTIDETETPTEQAARPSIGRPAGSLLERESGSSRLPTIGATPDAPEASDAEEATATDAQSALARFAADVDAPADDRPRMAIVLIDDGTGPLGPDTLDNFPFPVTFALDPGAPDAAARMGAYRSQGYEVAALAEIPTGAQPTDVEQVLAGSLAALPEAMALVEAPDSGVQSSRDNTEQVARFAAEEGHGLVFLPNGLNTAEAIALREEVPAVSVLRDFDGDGQDARTKRRFLDGAAFRARQDGSVVMLGRLTPDTVSALLLWSLQDRASSVSMVPVSSILLSRAE